MKVIFLGNSGTGKSSRLELCIGDTAGSERFGTTTLLPIYYRRARGAIVVYDLTNNQSFVDIEKKWMLEMSSHCSKVPSILLGNKFDLKI